MAGFGPAPAPAPALASSGGIDMLGFGGTDASSTGSTQSPNGAGLILDFGSSAGAPPAAALKAVAAMDVAAPSGARAW